MKTFEQAVEKARRLQEADGGQYAVVWTNGFIRLGPYFVVAVEQVPVLVEEGARLLYCTPVAEKVMA